MMHNILITGIPRSGTTLTNALIDSLPDCVALNEPLWQAQQDFGGNPVKFANWLAEDFARIRGHLHKEHPVPDRRTPEGKAITNFFAGDKPAEDHSMMMLIKAGLPEYFTLAMKHNALYMACLPEIAFHLELTIIALIRHPVHTIASWRRLNLPISQGKLPHGATYWPELHAISESNDELLIKQVKIYDLMCERLHDMRGAVRVLPYETLIDTPELLCRAIGHDGPLDTSMIKQNQTTIAKEEHNLIANAVLKHGKHWQHFYHG